MTAGAEPVERAIVFEDVTGYRRVGAVRCVEHWVAEYDFSLLQVDVALRAAGPVLFVILRFREDRFTEAAHATIVAGGEHAGGRVVNLSELEYLERGHFLSRFAECEGQWLGLRPDEVPAVLAEQLARDDERRSSVRHPVAAPAVVTVGARHLEAAVENLSAGGALVTTSSPPVLHSAVELEVQLPGGPVRAPATVVKVSQRGVALQFEPQTAPSVQARLDALPPVKLDSALTVAGLVAAPSGPQPGAVERLGRFELVSLLGRGGTSDVYFARVAEGPLQGQHVALKRLNQRCAQDAAAVRHFQVEQKTLSRLKHPNIVRTLDAGVFEGHHCLVMELIEGHDLSQLLRRCRSRKKQLPIEVACFAVKVLLDALGAVHTTLDEAGAPLELVHGDVSPHNVFVSKAGLIKLGDFGRTRRAGTQSARAVKGGRPVYLSPEALTGVVSPAADLWAAAVTLYELLTLEQPFKAETLDQLAQVIRTRREPPLRDVRRDCSGPLEAVLRAALEKDPKLRFQSAPEFAAALQVHFHPVRAPRSVPDVVQDLFST